MNSRLWLCLRVLANLLGAFGTLVAVVNPPAVFDSRQPVVFLFLSVSVALWGALWILGLRGPFAGAARILELGGLSATAIFIAYCLTRIPAVHDQLLVREHEGKRPYFGWSQHSDFLDPRYGPRLLRSDFAMASRYSLLRDYPTVNTVAAKLDDYALMYASLRLRGRSDEQILSDPIGPKLFLGTLLAESFVPTWWQGADWLRKDLPLHPTGGWKMGLLPAVWARTKFQTLLARPQESDRGNLEGLLVIALKRPGFATPQQLEVLLNTWTDLRKRDGYDLGTSLAARQGIAGILRKHALDGRVGVRLVFPATWSKKAREVYSGQMLLFLQAGGAQPELRDDGVPINLAAEFREWDDVAYTLQETVWREVEVRHSGGEIPGTHVFRSPYTTHRDQQQTVHSDGRGRIAVPTLVVRIEDKSFALPPTDVVNRNLANHLSECDPARDRYPDIYEEFLAALTLSPWRFGMNWPEPWPPTGVDATKPPLR